RALQQADPCSSRRRPWCSPRRRSSARAGRSRSHPEPRRRTSQPLPAASQPTRMSKQDRITAGEPLQEASAMQDQGNKEQGFTLIELLVAIVVVGILTAVAIVGIGGLTNKGSSSACSTSLDAARAAGAVYYANTGAYPTTFTQMTTSV